jgi:hypothetical protein
MTLQMKYERKLKELREKYLNDLQHVDDIDALDKAYEEGRKFGSGATTLELTRDGAQFSA